MTVSFTKILKSMLLPFMWIIGILLYIVVVLAKVLFILYETLIPRGLRELVPILNLWRKYLVYVSNLFSSHEKIELIKVEEEFDEMIIAEDRINKAYPIQRGVGETYDHVLILALVIVASLLIIQSQTASFDVLLDEIVKRVPWFQSLSERALWLVITVIAIICSTVMGMLSFIATVFGPIYALFHKSSLRMVRMGAYRWGSYFQRLEDLFALPYLASKASFSFFDAPPISPETYEEFKLDLMGDLSDLRKRFTNVLNLNPTSLSEKTQAVYKKLLSSEIEDRLDMTQVEDSISRAFALEIWQKETSLFPWKKEPGLALFAERNNLSYKEARTTFGFVTQKLQDKFVSKPFYSSILLTGALKGVLTVESKYDMPFSDLEYNQIAFSLALGAQRYIIDHFAKPKFFARLGIKIKNTSYGFAVPFIEFVDIFISYGKHIGSNFKEILSKGWTRRAGIFISSRFTEIQTGLFKIVFPEEETAEEEESTRKELKETFGMLWKGILFILKVILALPLSMFYMLKFFYQLFVGIWEFRKPEIRKKRKFEKDLAKESMVAMYQEIYSKMVLETFYYT